MSLTSRRKGDLSEILSVARLAIENELRLLGAAAAACVVRNDSSTDAGALYKERAAFHGRQLCRLLRRRRRRSRRSLRRRRRR